MYNQSGKNNPMYGKHHTEESRRKMGIANKLSMKGRNGNRCNSWKGGKTKLDKLIRERLEYINWQALCKTRDCWTCQSCNQRKIELHVHHIKPLSKIILENKLNNIEEAIKCKELWDINNGVTLCADCHKQTRIYNALPKLDFSSSIFLEPIPSLKYGKGRKLKTEGGRN